MVLRMTDASTCLLRLPGDWRVSCSTDTLVIEEGSPGLNRSVTGVMVLLGTVAVVAMFSLPLVGVLRATDAAWTDWLIALSALGFALLCGSLIVPLAVRLAVPWRLSLTIEHDRMLVHGGNLGRLAPVRRRGRATQIVLRPAYQRGDWGFQLWAGFAEGRPIMLMPPRILSASIREAENEGRLIADVIADPMQLQCVSMDWERHRLVADKRGHDV